MWCYFYFQMLRNCKVARALPRIADCAKNDRNAVLRARFVSLLSIIMSILIYFWTMLFLIYNTYRCCEYALLILEHWPDASEIHRSAELYEDLIKCCVGDAMSEVCTLNSMYQMHHSISPLIHRHIGSLFHSVLAIHLFSLFFAIVYSVENLTGTINCKNFVQNVCKNLARTIQAFVYVL